MSFFTVRSVKGNSIPKNNLTTYKLKSCGAGLVSWLLLPVCSLVKKKRTTSSPLSSLTRNSKNLTHNLQVQLFKVVRVFIIGLVFSKHSLSQQAAFIWCHSCPGFFLRISKTFCGLLQAFTRTEKLVNTNPPPFNGKKRKNIQKTKKKHASS